MKFLSQINVNTEYTLPIVDGTNGQVLATDGNGNVYWGSISVGATNLDGLTDVILTSPSSGQLLRYGIPPGSGETSPVWYNFTPNYLTPASSIDNLGDVTITSAASGQILQWNGSAWVNATLSTVEYVSKVQHIVKAGVAITKGQAVYVTTSDGTNMIVGLASNAAESTSSKVIGLAASNAATNDQIFVVTEGLLAGLNTSTATAGDPVWLGTNGNLIFGLLNKPVAPAHLVYIGVVTRVQQNNGEIFVNVQNGFELNEIHDALIVSPTAGQLLRRDSDNLWKNWTPNYLTAESDTLATVTSRGATTTGNIVVNGEISLPSFIRLTNAGANNAYISESWGINLNGASTHPIQVRSASLSVGYTLGAGTSYGSGNLFVSDKIGVNTTAPTKALDVVGSGIVASFGGAFGAGSFAGIHFGYSETQYGNDNYKKSALVFERTDSYIGQGGNAGGKIHFLLNNQSSTSATSLTHSALTIDTNANGTAGTARVGIARRNPIYTLDVNGQTNSTSFVSTSILILDADLNQSQQPQQGDPANKVTSFRWNGSEQGYIDTDSKITFAGFKTPAGTSSQFLKANGTVDSNTYLTTTSAASLYTTYDYVDDEIAAVNTYVNNTFVPKTRTLTINGTAFDLSANRSWTISTAETDTLATVTARGDNTSTALYLSGGSGEVPALHIRSGGSSWSEGLAIHPSSNSGYALTFYRTRAAYTDQTNTWAIGNLGDSNALNHFGLLRRGLTGGVADRPADAIFTVNPTGTFKFGFNPYVGTNIIWHAGNDGSGSGLDADLIDGIDSSSILWGNAKGTNDSITTDADGLDKTGFYTSSAFVTRPDGVDNWMYIQHIKLYNNNSLYQKQVGYDTYDDRMWVRTRNAGSWTSWKEIVTSDNIGSYALTSLPSHNHDDRYYTETESDGRFLQGTTNPGTPGNFTLSIGNNGTYSYVQSHSSQPLRLNPLGNALEGPSGSTIWHSGNDGASSGLDADLLDGQHGSYYQPASTAITTSNIGSQSVLYATNSTKLYASDSPYRYGDQYPYYMEMRYDGTYWNLSVTPATPSAVRVAYADSAGTASSASSATSAGTSTNLYGPAGSYIKMSTSGTSYQYNYQVRENDGGGSNTNEIYAPQLAFHWSGVVASSIMMEASGRIAIRNNPGTAYEAFIAGIIYSNGYGNSTQWNAAYGWGNHADAPYWNVSSTDPKDVESTLVTFRHDVTILGTLTESSSIRFKENITPLEPLLAKVNQLEAVSYNKVGIENREIGLIAEDVAELFPEVVTYNEEGQPQGIQYQRLSVILLKAVQELTERVNKLENK